MKDHHNSPHHVLARAARAATTSLLLAWALSLMLSASTQATTVTWTGSSGTDTNWSNGFNWDIGTPGPADDAVFSAAGVVYDASINNYVDVSTTINSLNYNQTGASTYHNTLIGDDQTLSIYMTAATNAVFVGSGTDLGSIDSLATISGTNGALAVTASNGVFNVRQGGFGHYSGTASLDMSGLSNATITVHNLLVAGDGSNALDDSGGRPADRASGVLNLAQYTTVNILGTTPVYGQPGMTLGFINGNGGAGGHLALGQTNYIYCDSGLAVGLNRAGSSNAPCTLHFNTNFFGMSPYALFRNLAGTGRQSYWLIGDASWLPYSGNSTAGTVDFSGGLLDAQVDQIVVARSLPGGNAGPGTASTGNLTFDTGTLDVNTLTVGYMQADYCAMVGGAVNVNGTARLTVNSAFQLGYFKGEDPAPTSTNGVSYARLNIGGGAVVVNGNITTTTSALNDANDSEIAVTNYGSLYVKGTVGPLAQLTLGSGATNTLDLGTSPNPSAPICTVTNLSTSPSVTLIVLGSALGNGTIHVIKYQNWTSGSFSDFVGMPPARYLGYFTNNTATLSIDFVITNTVADVWDGQTNSVNIGNWDINITPNWKNGALPHTYIDGDIAVLDDTAAGTTSVNLMTVLSPASMYFNITNKNYTLGGSGQLNGTASVTKNGSGTLTVGNSGANAFSGSVLINAGTIKLSGSGDRFPTNTAVTLANVSGATLDLNGQNQAIGSLAGGGTTGGEVKLTSGTLTVRGTTTTTYSGLISGSGLLMKTNTGVLHLSGANTYSGGTTISNGGVYVQNTTGSGSGSGLLEIDSLGALYIGNNTAGGSLSASKITANTAANGGSAGLYLNRNDDFTFTNFFSGAGQLYKINANTVTIASSNNCGGMCNITGGAIRIAHPNALGTATSSGKSWDTIVNNSAIESRLEASNNITVAERLLLVAKTGASLYYPHIVNVNGINTFTGTITWTTGGTYFQVRSDAGKIIFGSSTLSIYSNWASQGGMPFWELSGAGDGDIYAGIGGYNNCTNSVLKDGTGTWTLYGANSYSGSTTVSNGTLVVNGSVGMGAGGTGKIGNGPPGCYIKDFNVCPAGTLRGNGTIGTSVTNYGTLAPGSAAAIGILTNGNYLTLMAGSTNVFRVSQTGTTTNDQVTGITAVTYGGKLKVTLLGAVVGGEVFKLFSAATYNPTPFDSYDLPTLPSPLAWDYSQLTMDGTLRVSGTLANPDIGVSTFGRAPDGNFQMGGTTVLTNWYYRVLATNDVTAPLSTWPQVGTGTFAGGLFSFIDLTSTNYPRRFYRVVAP